MVDYQQVLAECYVTMIEVDIELREWREELSWTVVGEMDDTGVTLV